MPFVAIRDPVVALTHLNLIDGTGSPAKADPTIVLKGEVISAVGDSAATAVPAGARELNLSGHNAIPGLVGMHEHLFYPARSRSALSAPMFHEQSTIAAALYLAAGVTTARTAGAMEAYADLNTKRFIEEGLLAGPALDVTGPYLEGPGGFSLQMSVLRSQDQTRRLIDYWVGEGVTSFKAYMHVPSALLREAIEDVHRHGMKITGHLCSVGFREAAELGIDNLEHGLLTDSEFTPGKKPDSCPNGGQDLGSIVGLDVSGPEVRGLISTLVDHHVAVTSTLAVFEAFIPERASLRLQVLATMSPEAAEDYHRGKEAASKHPNPNMAAAFRKEMGFEREFVSAGGLLMAGCDPTGNGATLPGFGDQRNLELLVEAGFRPEQAIRIYTFNAAQYLGRDKEIGSIAAGKAADIVIVQGNPAARIEDVENVRYVFKGGIGWDSAKLVAAAKGSVSN